MALEALGAAQRVDELERRRVHEQQPTHGSGLLAGEPLNRQPAIRVPQGHHRAIEPELLETAPESGQLLTDIVRRCQEGRPRQRLLGRKPRSWPPSGETARACHHHRHRRASANAAASGQGLRQTPADTRQDWLRGAVTCRASPDLSSVLGPRHGGTQTA